MTNIDKSAETQTPILDLIGQRWSPRSFADQPVEPEKLCSVLEAARWAPSSRNEQPWAYLVATRAQPEEFNALLGVLMESNQVWAQKAPVLVMTVVRTCLERTGAPNRLALHDLGQATANLVMQATALGLATHQMGGFNVESARERFKVPSGWDPVSVIAVGYPGTVASLPESLRERETAQRKRKSLEEFVFSGTWGNPASITKPTDNK